MARQLVGLARHSAIYGVGGLIARVLAVVLLPLYTRYLTSSDYGAIGTLIALTTVLARPAAAGNAERVLPLLLRLEGAAPTGSSSSAPRSGSR